MLYILLVLQAISMMLLLTNMVQVSALNDTIERLKSELLAKTSVDVVRPFR